jgi:Double-stranded DNA-binding domain
MADPELAALRAARLTQLQQSGTDGSGQSGNGSEEAEKRRAEEQMKRDLLATALEPAARERRMSNCLVGPYAGVTIKRIQSVPYCARISYEVKSDRVYPLADGTNWPAPGTC